MGYITLGSRTATGVLDTTGLNVGNWTVTFDPASVGINIPYFEVQKMTIKGGAPNAFFDVYINVRHFSRAVLDPFGENEWEPTTDGEFVLRPGQFVYFYFSDAVADGKAPLITVWYKYDDKIEVNRAAEISGGMSG